MNTSIKYLLGILGISIYFATGLYAQDSQAPFSYSNIELYRTDIGRLSIIGPEISVFMTAILLHICLTSLLRYWETRKPVYQLSLLSLGQEKKNDWEDAGQEMKRDAGKTTVELPATAGLSALFYMTEEGPAEQEDDFLTRLRQVLEANMSDTDFDIPQLCRVLCVSTSQLHQKVKRFTGKSTSIYIRCLRLEKAKSLLTEQDWKISEIAYEVGFKNPTYFTQAFTQEFGVSPSSFRNQ